MDHTELYSYKCLVGGRPVLPVSLMFLKHKKIFWVRVQTLVRGIPLWVGGIQWNAAVSGTSLQEGRICMISKVSKENSVSLPNIFGILLRIMVFMRVISSGTNPTISKVGGIRVFARWKKGCIKADIKDVKKAREKTIKNFKKHGLVEQYRKGYTDLQWISR